MQTIILNDGVTNRRPRRNGAGRLGALATATLVASVVPASAATAQAPQSIAPLAGAAPVTVVDGSVDGVRVVLTNDDGVQTGSGSQGVFELRKALCAAGADVVVVGPWHDRSGASASITYGSGTTRFTLTTPTIDAAYTTDCADAPAGGAVYGACLTLAASPAPCDENSTSLTPADAATLGGSPGVQSLVGWPTLPDLIVSGTNRGGNDGLNVNVSGTVGAATIASSLGIPSIAISASSSGNWANNATAAATWSTEFIGVLVTNDLLPDDYIINVNYPRTDRGAITDAVWTTVAQLAAFSTGYTRDDLHFASVYGACTPGPRCGAAETGSDSAQYSSGKISIGAVSVNRTAGTPANSATLEAIVRAGLVSPVKPPVPEPVTSVAPARFWDTRNEPTVDTQFANTGRVAARSTFTVQVADRGDIPAGAEAVVVNLTVINPGAAGFATMFPCTDAPPLASHLNYVGGDVLANTAVVPLSGTGELCVFSSAPADYALDIAGFVEADSLVVSIAPARYLDTRTTAGSNTLDGHGRGAGRVEAGQQLRLQIGGRGDVPGDAHAAIVNITAVNPDAAGHLTVFDCGTRPLASTLNYAAGQVVANGAVATLDATGGLCIATRATTDLVVDVNGYVDGWADGIETATPARLLDTRSGGTTVDAAFAGVGRVGAGQSIEIDVVGRADVPAGANAAIVNVTVVNPAAAGYVTVYPCGTRPLASNVNHQQGQVRAGNSISKLSDTGTLCLFSTAETDLVLDVTGWVE